MTTENLRSFHAFVAMPFGTKNGIDFNRVYVDLIRPALEAEGFHVFRADEEIRAGNIRTDMFQELLLADLVVADLSIDNPNVWYELGVRHALRARGVIQIQCLRDYMPFDVYVDRTLRYHVDSSGVPDPHFLEQDRRKLGEAAAATIESWHGRRVSPVYHLLPNLKEPDWKSLRAGDVGEFWEAQDKWTSRIEVARRRHLPGDILTLAEELPTRALRMEAHQAAARALQAMGQYGFALEQCELALQLDPRSLPDRRQKGFLLGRLNRLEEAQEWLRNVHKDHSRDAETCAMLGRLEKERWLRGDFSDEAVLRESISWYAAGFRYDPSSFYCGINALTLLHLQEHLAGQTSVEREAMAGGVRWALQCAFHANERDYWARVTQADLALLTDSVEVTARRYSEALAIADGNWFSLDSTRQQLVLLKRLAFRPEHVEAALTVFDRGLARLHRPHQPRQVFLFSGHMIDKADRPKPRFPASMESAVAQRIADKFAELGASSDDLAIGGAACGADILFAEAAVKIGMHVEFHLPLHEPAFLAASVNFAGDQWRDRFYQLKNLPITTTRIMPDELGPTPTDRDVFSRDNLWMLYTARAWGDERLRFLALWDGKGGDGPGGTKDMVDRVRAWSGQVHILDADRIRAEDV